MMNDLLKAYQNRSQFDQVTTLQIVLNLGVMIWATRGVHTEFDNKVLKDAIKKTKDLELGQCAIDEENSTAYILFVSILVQVVELSMSSLYDKKLFGRSRLTSKQFNQRYCGISTTMLLLNILKAGIVLPILLKDGTECPSFVFTFFVFDLIFSVCKIPNIYLQFRLNKIAQMQVADHICQQTLNKIMRAIDK